MTGARTDPTPFIGPVDVSPVGWTWFVRLTAFIRNTSDKRASYVAIVSPGPYEKVLIERPETS